MTTTDSVRLNPQNKVVLTILLISTFVVFLNETILGVALPQIMKQLQIEPRRDRSRASALEPKS